MQNPVEGVGEGGMKIGPTEGPEVTKKEGTAPGTVPQKDVVEEDTRKIPPPGIDVAKPELPPSSLSTKDLAINHAILHEIFRGSDIESAEKSETASLGARLAIHNLIIKMWDAYADQTEKEKEQDAISAQQKLFDQANLKYENFRDELEQMAALMIQHKLDIMTLKVYGNLTLEQVLDEDVELDSVTLKALVREIEKMLTSPQVNGILLSDVASRLERITGKPMDKLSETQQAERERLIKTWITMVKVTVIYTGLGLVLQASAPGSQMHGAADDVIKSPYHLGVVGDLKEMFQEQFGHLVSLVGAGAAAAFLFDVSRDFLVMRGSDSPVNQTKAFISIMRSSLTGEEQKGLSGEPI